MPTQEEVKQWLKWQYRVLGHEEGKVTELRMLPSAISHFVTSEDEYVECAEWCIKEAKENGEGLYVGAQQRRDAVPGKSDTIPAVSVVFIDIDPIRGKDEPSTDLQHKRSLDLAERIQKEIGGSFYVSSGSGAHVFIPIQRVDVVNSEALTESLSDYFRALKNRYDTPGLKFDSVFDLPRVVRVVGSWNHKSSRLCLPVSPISPVKRLDLKFSQEPKEKVKVSTDLTELEQRFERLCKTNKRLDDLRRGSIHCGDGSASDADWEFVKELRKAQFSEGEVEELWHHNERGNDEPKKGDIARIFRKVQAENHVDGRAFSLANNVGSYYNALGDRKMGIRTGLQNFDEMVSGLKDGKLYIIGARPTTGKTTFITQVLTHIAEQGIPCLFFPTEVGAEPILDKIISRKGGIELKKFQNGTFNPTDVSKASELREYLKGLPLTIYEDFGLNIERFEQEIDKYAPKVVVLDYFQALKWDDSSSVGEKENAVRRIKKITKDRNIITICLSQLSRGGQNQGKVSLSELKGTGALEELGDVIAQMYRDDDGKAAWPIPISLVVTKSKYSATGTIYMDFNNTICSFKESDVQMQRGK